MLIIEIAKEKMSLCFWISDILDCCAVSVVEPAVFDSLCLTEVMAGEVLSKLRYSQSLYTLG